MSGETPDSETYALTARALPRIDAPALDYQPPMPRSYRPRIGVIGAGGIVPSHLDAYRTAGWEVTAICNRTRSKAEACAAEFYPEATVSDTAAAILSDPAIDVVDITPHPEDRLPLMRAALEAGKHVLSQKPFVADLEEGAALVALADRKGLKLAVNQNGRWSPHMAWMRAAVQAGLIGEVLSVHAAIHWDHGWIAGTPFEEIEDLVLYDFGIHWFDFLASIVPGRARSTFATSAQRRDPRSKVPLMAQALVQLEGGQASLVFDGDTTQGPRDTTFIAGTKGSLRSAGPDLSTQQVTLTTAEGWSVPQLTGTWFNDGFRGAMGALLVAIEEDAEPANGARANLESLALTFAAVRSRQTTQSVKVGDATRIAL